MGNNNNKIDDGKRRIRKSRRTRSRIKSDDCGFDCMGGCGGGIGGGGGGGGGSSRVKYTSPPAASSSSTLSSSPPLPSPPQSPSSPSSSSSSKMVVVEMKQDNKEVPLLTKIVPTITTTIKVPATKIVPEKTISTQQSQQRQQQQQQQHRHHRHHRHQSHHHHHSSSSSSSSSTSTPSRVSGVPKVVPKRHHQSSSSSSSSKTSTITTTPTLVVTIKSTGETFSFNKKINQKLIEKFFCKKPVKIVSDSGNGSGSGNNSQRSSSMMVKKTGKERKTLKEQLPIGVRIGDVSLSSTSLWHGKRLSSLGGGGGGKGGGRGKNRFALHYIDDNDSEDGHYHQQQTSSKLTGKHFEELFKKLNELNANMEILLRSYRMIAKSLLHLQVPLSRRSRIGTIFRSTIPSSSSSSLSPPPLTPPGDDDGSHGCGGGGSSSGPKDTMAIKNPTNNDDNDNEDIDHQLVHLTVEQFLSPATKHRALDTIQSMVEELNDALQRLRVYYDDIDGTFDWNDYYDSTGCQISWESYRKCMQRLLRLHTLVEQVIQRYNVELLNMFQL